MLVEFFGVPGAGKSTLVRAVSTRANLFTRHQLSAEWRLLPKRNQAAYIARALARGSCIAAAARLAIACRIRSRASIALLARVIAKNEWFRAQKRLVLLDQGFLQDLWSIMDMAGSTEPEPAKLSAFVRAIYSGIEVQIIFIEAEPAIAFERIKGRVDGNSRLDLMNDAELRNSLERAAQLPHRIVAGAAAAGLPVVRLDGSAPIESLVQKLDPFLGCERRPDRRATKRVRRVQA